MGGFRSSRVGRPGRNGRDVPSWIVLGLIGFLATILAGVHARAQNPGRSASKFVPDSSDSEAKLRTAAGHARDHQWSEAIDIYQKIIDRPGDKVVKVPKDEPGGDPSGDFALYLDSRRFCHRSLAHLPPEARELYRGRIDGLAESWYRQGSSRRDIGLLHRVLDHAFCSSWGDDALELLGDLAFQDGRFGEALTLYNQLVPDQPDDPLALIHPDPSVDLACVAAKKLLCRAAGDNPPSRADLDEFARRFPGATGSLAGKKGAYSSIVAQILAIDHFETGRPAGRPMADLRRLAETDPGRPGPDRRRPGAVACRAGEGLAGEVVESVRPADRELERPGGTHRAAAGLPPDRAGRPGHRLRRFAGPGL